MECEWRAGSLSKMLNKNRTFTTYTVVLVLNKEYEIDNTYYPRVYYMQIFFFSFTLSYISTFRYYKKIFYNITICKNNTGILFVFYARDTVNKFLLHSIRIQKLAITLINYRSKIYLFRVYFVRHTHSLKYS